MAQVEMLVQTYYRKPLMPGDVIEVTESVAERWEKSGIAKQVGAQVAPVAASPPKKAKGGKKNDDG